MTGIGLAPSSAMIAEDIRDLQLFARHKVPATGKVPPTAEVGARLSAIMRICFGLPPDSGRGLGMVLMVRIHPKATLTLIKRRCDHIIVLMVRAGSKTKKCMGAGVPK